MTATLAAAHDALLVDLDGTLIRGSQPIPGASDELERSGLPVVYVTNNASRAPADTATHLRDLGFDAHASDVMTSAQAAVVMLSEYVGSDAKILVVGHDSFRDLVRAADEASDFDSRPMLNWFLDEQIEEEATVSEIIDRLAVAGEDGAGILRVDAELNSEG